MSSGWDDYYEELASNACKLLSDKQDKCPHDLWSVLTVDKEGKAVEIKCKSCGKVEIV